MRVFFRANVRFYPGPNVPWVWDIHRFVQLLGLLLECLFRYLCNAAKPDYVFCNFPSAYYGDHTKLKPIASFNEKEGLTLVIQKETARLNNLNYKGVFKCISLNIISSLTDVGLTARVSKILADNEISANIYAGFYHDHIFVQKEMSQKALKLLRDS